MADMLEIMKDVVDFVREEKKVGLERAKEKTPITGQAGVGAYITEHRYEVANATVVNRVLSVADSNIYVDVTEKIQADMESSKGGITREHWLAVN